jgi:hypothetical protein
MRRWPIRILTCLALCGCQPSSRLAAPLSDVDCPSPNPCDDPGTEARLIPVPVPRPELILADYKPLKPGCPTTLQVMASPRPIAFGLRLGVSPDAATGPTDFFCQPPEAPLLRAGPRRQGQNLASR